MDQTSNPEMMIVMQVRKESKVLECTPYRGALPIHELSSADGAPGL